MERIKEAIKKNLTKMHRPPIYRYLCYLLAIPVNIVVFFVYTSRSKTNDYTKGREKIAKDLIAAGVDRKLKEEVMEQLQNKYLFLKQTVDEASLEKEANEIFAIRFNEIVAREMKQNKATSTLQETSFVSVFCELLENPLFAIFSVICGFPLYIWMIIYSNAYSKFISERVFMMVFVIFGVTFLVFTILYFSPMDPAVNILGPTATPEQVVSWNKTYGLDQSYLAQLFRSFKNLITFDLGKSYVGNEDIVQAISRKFPITLRLTFLSLLLSVMIAVPAGIISAIKPYSAYDYIFMFLALIGLSIPTFWMGYVLILNLSINHDIFRSTFDINDWKTMIMPTIVLGTSLAASVARMTRSSMLEVIKQDYIVTAKAKGLSNAHVILRHALGNAMIPIVTVIGLQFGGMLGGSAVTERVFNINGIGSYIVEKQFIPDMPAVLAGVVYVAIIISFVNLFVDILYALLDPRIKSKLKSY